MTVIEIIAYAVICLWGFVLYKKCKEILKSIKRLEDYRKW